jgi:5-methylcytosine-specific restriction endonuclease McrA
MMCLSSPKMNDRQKAIKQADSEFSKYIKARDKHTCLICGKVGDMDSAHYITRERLNTRWDELNAFPLCRACHSLDHSRPGVYKQAIINKYGEEAILNLERWGNIVTKLTASDIMDIARMYKAKREAMEMED